MAYVKTRLSPDALGLLLAVDTGPFAVYCLLADLGAGLKRGWAGSISVLAAEISERTGRAPSWHAVDRSVLKLRALGLLDVERQHRNLIVYWLRGEGTGGATSDRTFARSRETTQRSRETTQRSRETTQRFKTQRGRGRGCLKEPSPLSCSEERPASQSSGGLSLRAPPPAPIDHDLDHDPPRPPPALSPQHAALAEQLRNGDAPAKAPEPLEGPALEVAKAKAKGRKRQPRRKAKARRGRGRRAR